MLLPLHAHFDELMPFQLRQQQ